jgi:8-oxo-dGTP diphosphatase
METSGEPTHELMDDIRAVDWLPLDAAVERLSRAYERAFLENVGPIALESAALAQSARRSRIKKQPAPEKRRRQTAVVPAPAMPGSVAPPDVPLIAGSDAVEIGSPVDATTLEIMASPIALPLAQDIAVTEEAAATEGASQSDNETAQSQRINLVQKVRDWLRRAA